jgi:hypothetical protein
MCFAVSKIPKGKVECNNALVDDVRYYEQQRIEKEIEQAIQNPLSIGKQRPRAK